MANQTPVEDDPQQLEDARTFWTTFMQGTKWSIILIVIILIGLALAFVPSGS